MKHLKILTQICKIPMQILMIMLVLFYTQEIGQLKHILAK